MYFIRGSNEIQSVISLAKQLRLGSEAEGVPKLDFVSFPKDR